jgi:16S rRNA G966 N2-methylase RsmD
MPFAYYGAKHGLAAKYPRPHHSVIVEPFAGSAAYAVHHARRIEHAILIDADADVVALWHELQAMSVADVDAIGTQIAGERITHPLLAGLAGGTTMAAVLAGKSRVVTPRMRKDWPSVRNRIVAALPAIKSWDVRQGHYTDAPDMAATWFVDPPYQENGSMAGAGYRHPAAALDFDALGAWCRTRAGQVIVCEQSPAAWLPFHPFARQTNGTATGVGATQTRTEVIWRNDIEQPSLWGAA